MADSAIDMTSDSSQTDESDNSKKETLEKVENRASTSNKIIQPSRMMGFQKSEDGQKEVTPSRVVFRSSILCPSQLNGSGSSTSKPSFVLNPSRLNPFAKADSEEGDKGNCSTSSQNNGTPTFLPLVQNGEEVTQPTKKTKLCSTSIGAPTTNFVFGQNIQERVISDKPEEEKKVTSCTSENGTSNMLFSSALKETPAIESGSSSTPSKSLSESAREYEESHTVKRKFEEVEVKTGEEDETNVLQIMCKLFAFDNVGLSSWQERGRGNLRLNDFKGNESQNLHSRLVFRTSGSLRVVLNTKIWSGMTIQQASEKSIRLTALDNNGDIKVFLLMGNGDDIRQLRQHLESRVKSEIERQNNCKES